MVVNVISAVRVCEKNKRVPDTFKSSFHNTEKCDCV